MESVELSFVIPVFNGARTVGDVVRRIVAAYTDLAIEVVLVNDGSGDDSERVCRALSEEFPNTVIFVNLSRNFGEHNAVLAGLSETSGRYVAALDDDGQNPPEEVRRLYDGIRREGWEVAYGAPRRKRDSWARNLASRVNDAFANVMLKKPRALYLSSFRVMSRFVVQEITAYKGPFPYIDGLILRTTRNVGQIQVEHEANPDGRINYTLRKLIWVWLNLFLNFSTLPLRAAVVVGLLSSIASLLFLAAMILDWLFVSQYPRGVPTVLAISAFFFGIQLTVLGLIGEYLGRLFLDHSGAPQSIVRYVKRREPTLPGS